MKPDDVLLSALLPSTPVVSSASSTTLTSPSQLTATVISENSNSSGFFNLSAVVNSMNNSSGNNTASAGGSGQPDAQDLSNIMMSSESSTDLFLQGGGTDDATEALLFSESDPKMLMDLNEMFNKDPTLSTLASVTKVEGGSSMPIPVVGAHAGRGEQTFEEALSAGGSLNNGASSSFGRGNNLGGGAFGTGSSAGSNVAVSPLGPETTSPATGIIYMTQRPQQPQQPGCSVVVQQQQQQLFQQQQPFHVPVKEESMDSTGSLTKLELADFDADFNIFTNEAAKDVNLGGPYSGGKPANVVGGNQMSQQTPVIIRQQQPRAQPVPAQAAIFSTASMSTHSGGFTFAPVKDLLSSSVPSTSMFNASPLSDILSELPTASAGGSPSHAGPERHGHGHSTPTLHKLLRNSTTTGPSGGGGHRPSPVRSPEAAAGSAAQAKQQQQQAQVRAQRMRMRNSLSAGSGMLSQSAPSNQSSAEHQSRSGTLWARREPRQHISSVCSVNDSSLADEVSEALSGISPNDLPDIDSEDEEDSDEEDDVADSDEDGEGATGKGSSKKERHFWQYNVQAKGPKGQKIVVETKIEDPHVFTDIVDPVFSGGVELQGIKHSGKARRGDGNDLTSNPKKLAAIGKELDQLSREINTLTPVSEMPFNTRCKSRKEKNKLASRACRLKKKAQHEANKLKCHGLEEEHHYLMVAIERAKELVAQKVDPNVSRPQEEITKELDDLVKKQQKHRVAGHTTEYVNRQVDKYMKDV